MGVNKGQMLDAILSQRTAIKSVAAGWMYSITIALLMAFLIPDNAGERLAQTSSCLLMTPAYDIRARTLIASSILGMILAVVIIQLLTFYKLHKRLNNSVGCVTNQGLNKLFKRAMTKSAMVAGAFSIGWGPSNVMIILYDWSNLDLLMLEKIIPFLFALGILQGFCNAIIFRFKHIKEFIQKKICC